MKEENRKPVDVTIMGQKFSLRSEHNDEYVKKVADYVNAKMTEIGAKSGSVSSLNIAILASMTIADAYFELIEDQKIILEDMLGKSKKIISFIEDRLV